MKKTFLFVLILQVLLSCKKNNADSQSLIPPLQEQPKPIATTYYEDFDAVDESKWEYQLYTFDGNGCNMKKENVTVQQSILSLRAEKNQDSGLPKKYNGGELGDRRFHKYGYFSVRMKPAACSGTVSAFFLMNKWVPENWEHKEIDIEFLGKERNMIQCTTHDFQDGGKTWKSSSKTLPLGFDYSAGFHEYGILWTPDYVAWFVDDKNIHTDTLYVPKEPLHIRMNNYVGDMAVKGFKEWLGDVDTTCLPATIYYDRIRVEELKDYQKRVAENR